MAAARGAVDLVDRQQAGDQFGIAVAEKAGDAVLDDLRRRTLRTADDRCATRQRFKHGHAERLAPADRVEQGRRRGQQFALAVSVDLAEEDHVVAEVRAHELVEVRMLVRLAHLGGDLQSHPRGAGNCDRPVNALVRHHPPEQRDVAAVARTERVVLDVDAVMHDGVDG